MSIILEIKYFFSDIKNFINPRYKFVRSKLSIFLRMNRSRIILFRIPQFIFKNFHRKKIQEFILSNKDLFISSNFEYFTSHIQIKDYDIKFLKKIKGNSSRSGALNKSKGGNEFINIDKDKSYAKYHSLDSLTFEDQNRLFGQEMLDKIFKACSILCGYKVKFDDVSFSLAETKGENSNSFWHSDAYFPVIKGFVCLTSISKEDSPFQYSEGTTDLNLLEKIYNDWAFYKHSYKANSPRIVDKNILSYIEKMKKSMTGSKGFIYVANTSGLHKKGLDLSEKKRILLFFGFKRLDLLSRIKRSFFF